MLLCGIDYGSKLAGTTVICFLNEKNKEFSIKSSVKKQDADDFLKKELNLHKPDLVFIDAPLSLPLIYSSKEVGKDFFYRVGDRILGAMSPMFLGGLTARAMKLKSELSNLIFYETYPARQAKRMNLSALAYKESLEAIPNVLEAIKSQFEEIKQIPNLNTWHEIDAVLALIGAIRYVKNENEVFGDEMEGCIYV